MMTPSTLLRRERPADRKIGWLSLAAALMLGLSAWASSAEAQILTQGVTIGDSIVPIEMAIGRSIPMTTRVAIQRVSVADPDVADVVLIAERELVVNALSSGLTDLIIWQTDGRKYHFRVSVHSPTDRKQVILQVRFAEVSTDFLREIGTSLLFRDQHTRAGTGQFATRGATDSDGNPVVRDVTQFLSLLSIQDIDNFSALINLAEQSGHFRILAEPNLIAADGEEASFLAGGELPIPVAQTAGVAGAGAVQPAITIEYREFGIRLSFTPEILSEDLIKLKISPEVSSLDFSNAVVFSGFAIPAFRVRRTSTTVDLRNGQTLAISGLLNSVETKLNTGVPILKDIPILGLLFSSQRFQRDETELLVLVQPIIVDPMSPPAPPPLPGGDGGGE